METVYPIRHERDVQRMAKLLSSNPRNYLLFMLGITSALRISDLLLLKIKNIWDGKEIVDRIVVHELKTDRYDENGVKIKAGKRKEFPVTDEALPAIKLYLNSCENLDPEQYLFLSRKGDNKPITRHYAEYMLSEAAKSLNIKDNIGSHSLRKTWAYHAFRQGIDPTLIMEALNHDNMRDTLKYICITQDELNTAYKGVKYGIGVIKK